MKRIKKITSNISTVAGSALLVGATVLGGASLATAQSGSSGDLGDYPQPFVDEDGNVDTQIVVGQSAKTIDVVGAVDIAGSLGNAAFQTERKTVAVSGAGGSWSATDGVTLDTRNDDVFFGQNITTVRETLTDGDLEKLEDTEFEDDSGTTYDITHNLNVGTMEVKFGNNPDELDNEDPELHLEMPSETTVSTGSNNYVLKLTASLESIDVEDSDVAGEDITLWGKDYTIASDHSDNSQRSFLKLFGSQQEVDVQTGESKTINVDGQEVTIEVESVDASNDDLSVRVNGKISSESEGDTINVEGTDTDIRVDELINTGSSDDGQGIAKFDVGSEELRIHSGDNIEDSQGDDYKGTYAEINGNTSWDSASEISSIDIYVGAEDDEEDALTAGESFSHSLFEQFELHFGGLNPNAEEGGENVGELTFTTQSDDTVAVDMTTPGGDTASLPWANDNSDLSTGDSLQLQDSDQDSYVVLEGENVTEDEYFTADPGDFNHVWEVTSIDRDTQSSDLTNSDDEAEIDLQDAITGNSVTVDIDADTSQEVYEGDEIIDGQKYHFVVQGDSNNPSMAVAWGDGADVDGGDEYAGLDTGDRTTAYAAQDTESDSAVALTTDATGLGNDTIELPSTESTDAKTFDLLLAGNSTTFTQDQVTYNASDLDADGEATLAVADTSNGNVQRTGPVALAIQPEDDNDEEHAYIVEPGVDNNDEEVGTTDEGSIAYTGNINGNSGYSGNTVTLESDDDIEAGYSTYGTFSWEDTDDQGDFTLNVPFGQATAGGAVTAQGGELTGSGGGSGAVETHSPTGWPDVGMLDSDVTSSHRQNSNMILVGGPAVNTLVSDLAEANKTWTADQYSQGQAIVQHIDNAFSQGNDALVVAGFAGQDTREASSFISNYADHQSQLSGQSQVTLTTTQSQSAQ